MGLSDMLRRLGLAKSAPTTRMDQMTAALHTSVVSILKDATPEDQSDLLDETLDQYREAVLDAAQQQSAFAKAGAPPFANADGDDDGDPDTDTDDDGDGTCPDCGTKGKKGTVCKKCGTKVAKLDTEATMDAALKKEYDDTIAALEAKLAEQAVQKTDVERMSGELEALRKIETQRTNLAKAATLLGEFSTPEELEQTAAMIEKGIDTTLIEKLAKQRAAFAKAAALTVEVGTSVATDATSPNAQIAKAAADIISANPKLTKEQAIARAITENPALYAATI